MFKIGLFKNALFKWMPHKEQYICERKLMRVIKRLKIEDYNFNWDRNSCFIEFHYQTESYRLEHSIEKAKEKGIILRNGLDCLNELTQSLEDLCVIIDRGTYKFEAWISGMKQSSPEQEIQIPEFHEEFHIRYKSLGIQNHSKYNKSEEFIPNASESSLRDFDRNQFIQRPQDK
ncbi:hypothetical protein MUO14_07500 [Halobacillus shinanisalinarum]|uniref:Uncharacterized protein n=1 Tax=Halobacillus shinanisalinarum TaxID=2932258 RepID=A0ABY4H2S6_9BACI|nr:hypothetical protein [Halobacillus shinanisalinarum]UOQ94768.1 hypothetical protein MUO14_07500 [Halobacillus shinanisalinarum]